MAPKLPTAELLNNFAICNAQPITTLHLTKARTKRHNHLICCKLTFQNTQVKQLLVHCVEKILTQCPFHKTYLTAYFHKNQKQGKTDNFQETKTKLCHKSFLKTISSKEVSQMYFSSLP